jgi:hypothetical protein
MPWPTHGHEVTRGFFRALTRPRQAVRVELRPTYFPGQAFDFRRTFFIAATSGMPDAIKPEFADRRWAACSAPPKIRRSTWGFLT